MTHSRIPAVSLFATLVFLIAACSLPLQAQQAATANSAVVPTLVQFSGVLTNSGGKPVTQITEVTFYLYQEQQGGAPLWMETQNVQPNQNGQYTAMLGSTSSTGLPTSIFGSGEARWLGVQVQGQAEQPRVMLLSVPYALKAGDAQTVGGLPASAFVLAASPNANPASATNNATNTSALPATTSDVTTSGGTVDFVPLWDATSDITSSVMFQSGSGSTAKIGINTTTPATTLDVKGSATIRGTLTTLGTLSLPATGAATSTAGKNSEPETLAASAFNSSTSKAVSQTFRWQAEPAGNDTSSPSGTLNLLFAEGTSSFAETGLNIASNGQITFATGQTFPVPNAGITNAMLQNSSLTVTAGTDLTGGGVVALGGTTTLNLDTTKVPVLAGTNSFTGSNSFSSTTGNGLSSSSSVPGDSGVFATNSSTTGSSNGLFASTNSAAGAAVSAVNNSTASGSALGVYAQSDGSAGTGVFGVGNLNGVWGTTPGGSGNGVLGVNTASSGNAYGVQGQSSSSSNSTGVGVFGTGYTGVSGTSSSGLGNGVFGFSAHGAGVEGIGGVGPPLGAGVYGQNSSTMSNTGKSAPGIAGVWGDGGGGGIGVEATTDSVEAGWFENDSSNIVTLFVDNAGGGDVFTAEGSTGRTCTIDGSADLTCSGTIMGTVLLDGGSRKVALAAIQSPKNWFEDFGSSQLSNGSAVVAIDHEYAQTVNTEVEYHVFLTPNGDCKGLYVTHRTPTSFEVRELGGGTSNVEFSYRIVALRRNYENIRLKEHTNDIDARKQLAQMRSAVGSRLPTKH